MPAASLFGGNGELNSHRGQRKCAFQTDSKFSLHIFSVSNSCLLSAAHLFIWNNHSRCLFIFFTLGFQQEGHPKGLVSPPVHHVS